MKAPIAIAAAALILAGCQHTKSGPSAARDIRAACGSYRTWSPDYQRQLAAELGKLPPTHPVWALARDAIAARDAIRICRGEGVPRAVIEAVAAEARTQARKR